MPTVDYNVEEAATLIYSGGELLEISEDELVGNKIAIRQLVNSHNLTLKRLQLKDIEIHGYKSEIEYLKTSPFIAIIATIVNALSIVIIGIGINIITSNDIDKTIPSMQFLGLQLSTWLISVGLVLNIVSTLGNVLYPYARKWFNK